VLLPANVGAESGVQRYFYAATSYPKAIAACIRRAIVCKSIDDDSLLFFWVKEPERYIKNKSASMLRNFFTTGNFISLLSLGKSVLGFVSN
jgi:hypothetical protein